MIKRLHALMLVGLEDQRVLLDAMLDLNNNRMLAVITSVVASGMFYLTLPFVRDSAAMWLTLLTWCGITVFQLRLGKHVKWQSANAPSGAPPLSPSQAHWHGITMGYCVVGQAVSLSTVSITSLLTGNDGMNSPAAIGALLFFIGGALRNARVRCYCGAYAIILLGPLSIYFFTRTTLNGAVIGAFFLLMILTVLTFSRNSSQRMTAEILQRYELQDLNLLLQAERQRADSANEAKSRFFTAASHDARQPLQAITLLSDSLVKSEKLTEPDRRLAERITANLHSIRNLFNRVLDISRIDSGAITVSKQPLQLQALFDTLDVQFAEQAANKGLWLRFAPTEAVVLHDAHLLERMLGNLLDNAIKYTNRGGVWIAFREQRARIEVRDSGAGISVQEQKLVFEEFFQIGNQARNRESGAGLGLGLSIVQRLATMTESTVGIRSAPGRGSTFWVSMPPSTVTAQQALHLEGTTEIYNPQHQTDSPQPLKGLYFLLVEDDQELLVLWTERLRERGAQLHACASTQQVQHWLGQANTDPRRCDMIITDFRLDEGGTGLDVIRWTRRAFENTVPAIVITGDTAIDRLAQLRTLPLLRLMHKPVHIDDLIAQCRTAFGLGAD